MAYENIYPLVFKALFWTTKKWNDTEIIPFFIDKSLRILECEHLTVRIYVFWQLQIFSCVSHLAFHKIHVYERLVEFQFLKQYV